MRVEHTVMVYQAPNNIVWLFLPKDGQDAVLRQAGGRILFVYVYCAAHLHVCCIMQNQWQD